MSDVSDASPRLTAKRRAVRRRRLVRIGVAALLLMFVAGAALVVGVSRVFDLRVVMVEGNEIVSGSQLVTTADAPIGTPMVWVDTGLIAGRVASIPAVESAIVSTRWPHTIVVHVTERTLVVQRVHGASWQWVDRSGVVFHETPDKTDGVVVVQTASIENRYLADAVTVAGTLTPPLLERLQFVRVDAPDQITLVLADGQSVVWGSAEESTTKAQVATALLAVDATVYDVSSPSTPTSR